MDGVYGKLPTALNLAWSSKLKKTRGSLAVLEAASACGARVRGGIGGRFDLLMRGWEAVKRRATARAARSPAVARAAHLLRHAADAQPSRQRQRLLRPGHGHVHLPLVELEVARADGRHAVHQQQSWMARGVHHLPHLGNVAAGEVRRATARALGTRLSERRCTRPGVKRQCPRRAARSGSAPGDARGRLVVHHHDRLDGLPAVGLQHLLQALLVGACAPLLRGSPARRAASRAGSRAAADTRTRVRRRWRRRWRALAHARARARARVASRAPCVGLAPPPAPGRRGPAAAPGRSTGARTDLRASGAAAGREGAARALAHACPGARGGAAARAP